jgi:hypothetical protein
MLLQKTYVELSGIPSLKSQFWERVKVPLVQNYEMKYREIGCFLQGNKFIISHFFMSKTEDHCFNL